MKRAKTKVLSILLAVVMMLGMMPSLGQVVHAAGEQWTITVHLNGGSGVSNGTVKDGEYWAYTDPTKDGYTFAGWYTDPALDSYHYWSQAPVHSNLDLYAKWWENLTSVSVNGTIPVAGQHPDLSTKTVSNSDYTIVHYGMDYIESGIPHPIDETHTFSAGEKIRITVALGATDYQNKEVIKSANVTINGKSATFSHNLGDAYRSKVFYIIYTIPNHFTTQPTGGTAANDDKFAYNWACSSAPDSVNLEVNIGGTWMNLGPDTKQTPAYADISHTFRVAAKFGSDTIYSDSFTVTWSSSEENKFITQPQDAVLAYNEDYVGSWSLNFTPENVKIERYRDDKTPPEWVWLTGASATGGTIPSYDFDVTNTYRVAAIIDGTWIYSDEFTVKWQDTASTTYTITFDSNGGTGTMDPVTKNKDESYTLPANGFTAPLGKVFDKWEVTIGTGTAESKNPGDSITITADTTVKALWKDEGATTYTVTASNDGNGTASASPTSGATGTEVTLTATPNSGYKFKEWQVVSGGVTVTDNKFAIGTENVEVKAIFEAIPTYTVTFETNGGSAVTAQTVEEGNTATELTAPTKSGYTFDGWYADATFSAAFDFTTPITADTTVYAKWKENSATQVTVTFDSDGGSSVPAQTINSGEKATKPSDPTKDGYTFKGWYYNGEEYNFNNTVEVDITLKAKWEVNSTTTYTVSFNTDGGSAVADQTIDENGTATKPSDLTKSGYTFDGWYADATFGAAFDFTTPITADTTIYAKWKANTSDDKTKYTITYNLNGGTMDGKTGTVTVDYEDGTTITLPTPTRDGYTFDYWEGSRYEAGASYKVTENHTFTAQWKKNSSSDNNSSNNNSNTNNNNSSNNTSTNTTNKHNVVNTGVKAPATGDNSNIALWGVVLMASLLGFIFTMIKRRRYSR